MTNIDLLLKGAPSLGLELGDKEIKQFNRYKELLKKWNEKINITAITDDEEIDIKHFLDSLTPFTTGIFNGKESLEA